jgi:hypothetical protein
MLSRIPEAILCAVGLFFLSVDAMRRSDAHQRCSGSWHNCSALPCVALVYLYTSCIHTYGHIWMPQPPRAVHLNLLNFKVNSNFNFAAALAHCALRAGDGHRGRHGHPHPICPHVGARPRHGGYILRVPSSRIHCPWALLDNMQLKLKCAII